MRILWLGVLGMLVWAAPLVAGPTYYPLNNGDRWTYDKVGAADESELKVAVGSLFFGWARVGGDDGAGAVYLAGTQSETSQRVHYWDGGPKLLFDFTPGATSWPVKLGGPCGSGKMRIVSRTESVKTSAGSFSDCIRIKFDNDCYDTGISSLWFAPDVGLVRWAEVTIEGEVLFELKKARVRGKTYPAPTPLTGVTHGLTLDKLVYVIDKTGSGGSSDGPVLDTSKSDSDLPESVTIKPADKPADKPVVEIKSTFHLVNHSGEPVTMEFLDGQEYEILITDRTGDTVLYKWSVGKVFTDMVWSKTVKHGEHLRHDEAISLRIDGKDLEPGKYLLIFKLTSSDHPFVAATPFTVLWMID